MEGIRSVMIFVFEKILYPLVVALVLGFLIMSGASVIARQRSGRDLVAGIASAVLPALALIFLVAMKLTLVPASFIWLKSAWGFALGATLSVAVMELRKSLPRGGLLPQLYVMFSFSLAAGIIYFYLSNAFGLIEPALAGFVIAGCVHLIFRAGPEIHEKDSGQPGQDDYNEVRADKSGGGSDQ